MESEWEPVLAYPWEAESPMGGMSLWAQLFRLGWEEMSLERNRRREVKCRRQRTKREL
jgi:hypothetical protein